MRKAFQMFDKDKSGFIETLKIATILNTMGQLFDDSELQGVIAENDPDGELQCDTLDIHWCNWMIECVIFSIS